MLEGVFPVWFDDVKGGILERLLRLSRHVPPGRPARLPLLLRRRPAPPLQGAGRRGASWSRWPTRWRRASAARSTGSTCPSRASASTRRTTRRCGICACAPRPSSTSGWSTTPTASREPAGAWRWPAASSPASASPPSAAGAGGRPPPSPTLLRIHAAVSAPIAAARRAAAAVRVALRLRARARPGLDPAADGHLRSPVRHRREPRLVPQPRSDRGGSGPPPEGRPPADRLLGGDRHPARPAQSENLRPSGRHADRRQLAQVPPRRARQVRRRGARRASGSCAGSRRSSGSSSSTRSSDRSWWPGRPTPSRPRTRSISTGTCRRPSASWARVLRPGGRVFVQSGQHPQPPGRAQRVDPGRDRVGDPRGRDRTGPQRPALCRLPARCSTTSRACARTSPTGTRSSCPCARWTTISAAWKRPASPSRRSRPAPSRPRSGDWFEFLSAYHEAVLGWVGTSAKVDGKAPSREAVADRLALIRHAMDTLFGGRDAFRCCWTYINCVRP